MKRWLSFVRCSASAVQLQSKLSPVVVEEATMRSTAYTDVVQGVIHINVSQPPLKTALSYCYELKNLENKQYYVELRQAAKNHEIIKAQYVQACIKKEAEAVYFRCQAFHEMGEKEDDFPLSQEYLKIYHDTETLSEQQRVQAFFSHICECGTVRRGIPVKKYYADCYDTLVKAKAWPVVYEIVDEQRVIPLPAATQNPQVVSENPMRKSAS
jgi:hypothetical protein